MAHGIFITFEGGDGSGKTTLINKLASYLEEEGHEVFATREPGGSELSEKIRKLVLDDHSLQISPMAELLLYLAARAQQVTEKIGPELKAGKIVLCDRFNDSTVVYQGVARKLGLEKVKHICELVTGDIQPQLTLFLDVPPELGLKRAGSKPDRIETEGVSFQKKVREGYHTLAKAEPNRIQVLDTTETPDVVYNRARHIIDQFLKEHHYV